MKQQAFFIIFMGFHLPNIVSDLRVQLLFASQMPQRSCWKYQVLENWKNVTYECFRKMWRCALQSFSEIIRFQNNKYFLGIKTSYYVGCTKPHTVSCKRIETAHTSCKLEKMKTFTYFTVLSLAGNNTLPKLAALIYTQFVFSMVLSLQ